MPLDQSPQLYIFAGPNGCGKTTSAQLLLTDLIRCDEYVNADQVAAALNPQNPESAAIAAGRVMLERLRFLANQKLNFAFESTLSSKVFLRFIRKCQIEGYSVSIAYFWLPTYEMAIGRVRDRVAKGGHHIPSDIVTRRYYRSIHNFLSQYTKVADNWYLYDNSSTVHTLVARKHIGKPVEIINHLSWMTFNRRTQDEEAAEAIPELVTEYA